MHLKKNKQNKQKKLNNNVVLKVPVTGVPRDVGVFSLADFLAEYRLFIIHIKAIAPPAGVLVRNWSSKKKSV